MDTRDLNQTEVPCPGPDVVKTIWGLQLSLIEHYKKIEHLPEFPLNLDLKEHQALIKDFVGRVIEELAEGHEHYRLGNKALGDEEIADALHFLVELLIFTHGSYDEFKRVISPDQVTVDTLSSRENGPDIAGDFYLESNPYWAVTYYLNLARNSLRNKPWKQTEIRTRTSEFYANLYNATFIFFRAFWNKYSYEHYYLKNQINLFRILSKY